MPQKGEFGSTVCVKRDRWIVYIVSQTADANSPNPFEAHIVSKGPHGDRIKNQRIDWNNPESRKIQVVVRSR